MTTTADLAAALSPAATLPLDAIGIDSFPKDSHGYYLIPPSVHLRAARARGWRFAIRTASALVHYTSEWAAAMTAYYGTTGLHESWTGPDGTPSAEALEKFPSLRRDMDRAAERWDSCVEWEERLERSGRGGGPYARWWAAREAMAA